MPELSASLYERVKTLCAAGDGLADAGSFDQAIEQYQSAWSLLPEPKLEWRAATWLLAAIGDAYFLDGRYDLACRAFAHAMHGPEALGNPFLHFRLGQCRYELGDLPAAGDELTRAYMGSGGELFLSADARYYDFLKSILAEPPGGWD